MLSPSNALCKFSLHMAIQICNKHNSIWILISKQLSTLPREFRFSRCSINSQRVFYQVKNHSGYALVVLNLIKHCCSFIKHYIKYLSISNSLIMHKIKTQEINTETEFGYVMYFGYVTHFSVFGYLDKTLFLVFDILHLISYPALVIIRAALFCNPTKVFIHKNSKQFRLWYTFYNVIS